MKKVSLMLKIFCLCLFFLTIVMLWSCSTCLLIESTCPRDVRKSIKYCYDSIQTGLDTIIPINGLYRMFYKYDLHNIPDSTQTCLVFYKDGLFLRFQEFYWKNHIENNDTIGTRYLINQFWGNYVVNRDTIKTFYFNQPCETAWGGFEEYYCINKDKTLTLFYSSQLTKRAYEIKYYEELQRVRIKNATPAIFHHIDTLPDPKNSWIIKAKWFRCKK